MTGILDPKTRIFDTILTNEGRRQLAEGTLRLKFYSFSDLGAIYKNDTLISGSSLDETDRFLLEALGLPQDSVTYEADDGGKLIGIVSSGSEKFSLREGQIFSGSVENQRIHVTGSQFTSISSTLLSRSINNFSNLMILRSPDPVDDKERDFVVRPRAAKFTLTNEKPFKKNEVSEAKINHIESLFLDKKLSHIPNFKFLPPVNKARTGETERKRLGNYINYSQRPIQSFEELQKELQPLIDSGFSQEVRFDQTSRRNNIFGQFFEVSGDQMKKLDVIDFGEFPVNNQGGTNHVFFVGKVFIDDNNVTTFVNMFTLLFEND